MNQKLQSKWILEFSDWQNFWFIDLFALFSLAARSFMWLLKFKFSSILTSRYLTLGVGY